jgi:hypothetical protein
VSYDPRVARDRYRLLDTAGSEIDIVELDLPEVDVGVTVRLADGTEVAVLDVYDEEDGTEGGVRATLVIDVD